MLTGANTGIGKSVTMELAKRGISPGKIDNVHVKGGFCCGSFQNCHIITIIIRDIFCAISTKSYQSCINSSSLLICRDVEQCAIPTALFHILYLFRTPCRDVEQCAIPTSLFHILYLFRTPCLAHAALPHPTINLDCFKENINSYLISSSAFFFLQPRPLPKVALSLFGANLH